MSADQVVLWSAFAARVELRFPFCVDIVIEPFENRAQMAVVLHVLDRDTREPIKVRTRRPCAPWTNDDDAIEELFDLIDIAFGHEIDESVRLDGELCREVHREAPKKGGRAP